MRVSSLFLGVFAPLREIIFLQAAHASSQIRQWTWMAAQFLKKNQQLSDVLIFTRGVRTAFPL
jgi:hypothetical protein